MNVYACMYVCIICNILETVFVGTLFIYEVVGTHKIIENNCEDAGGGGGIFRF